MSVGAGFSGAEIRAMRRQLVEARAERFERAREGRRAIRRTGRQVAPDARHMLPAAGAWPRRSRSAVARGLRESRGVSVSR